MSKLVKDLQKSQCPKLIHIKDIAHLIHVDHALHSPSVNVVRQVVIRFGAVFKHASKLERVFYDICHENGLADEAISKPPSVAPTRWFSFYRSAVVVCRLWQVLLAVIDSSESSGKKVNELCMLVGDQKNRQFLLVKLVCLIETLIISMLSDADVAHIKLELVAFNKSLAEKWQATCQRNLSEKVCGPSGLWKQ